MISSDCSSVPFSGARPASTVDDIRIHSVDEGLRDADPVLMLHGEPSWSYLYRKVLPGIVAAGGDACLDETREGERTLAPDLAGTVVEDSVDLPGDVTDTTLSPRRRRRWIGCVEVRRGEGMTDAGACFTFGAQAS